jgi:multicomponent Na+:H+ antiporter subunit C
VIHTNLLYSLAGLALFAGGLFGLIACSHLLRKILAANIISSGVFLLLVATAYQGHGSSVDPVPHAMVLTGIVVSISTTALALILACRVQETSNLSLSQSGQQLQNPEESGE